jgi:lysine 2,3-aminomutase
MQSEMPTVDLKKPLVWDDWRSQLQHRITTVEQLRQVIHVTENEEKAIAACEGKYRWSITPYYASLMDKYDEKCPIRQQAVPNMGEVTPFANSSVDPVGDTYYRKTNRVVHKYPDRVVVLVTELCPVYCRHCTRKFHTTDLSGSYFEDSEAASWEPDFDYIARTPAIRDVLLTGGDPLTYSDKRLEYIISRLRQIPHVEIIRIGSRYPVLLPQRITNEFCEMLEKYHPIWLNTHFNHPKEITPESAAAVDRLLRHGIPVGNQTVLLKGINDDLETMRDLLKGLLKIRVRPYYLYHCDNVTGVSHFITDLEKGREIMRGLLGHMTGFAVPQYVLTTPLGKIPLWEESVWHDEDGNLWVKNYKGEQMNAAEMMIPTSREE